MHYFFFCICTTSACATLNFLTFRYKGLKKGQWCPEPVPSERCLEMPDTWRGAGQPSRELLIHTPPPFRDKSEPGWAPASDTARRIATPLGKPLNYNYGAAEAAALCSSAFEVVTKRAQHLFSFASQLLMLFCPPKRLIHPHEDGFNRSEEKERGETFTNSAGQILNMLQEMPPPTAHPDQTPPASPRTLHPPSPSPVKPSHGAPALLSSLELPKPQLQTSAFPMNILCSLLNKWFQDRASYYS